MRVYSGLCREASVEKALAVQQAMRLFPNAVQPLPQPTYRITLFQSISYPAARISFANDWRQAPESSKRVYTTPM